MNTTTQTQMGDEPTIKCKFCDEKFNSYELKAEHEPVTHPKEYGLWKNSITSLFKETLEFSLKSNGNHMYNIPSVEVQK